MTSTVKATPEHAVIMVAWDDVHSLRVALAECPCKSTKSHSTSDIRARIDKALARLVAGRKS